MIPISVLLSSVAATSLALLATSSPRLSAGFRHRLLFASIVLVPLGTLVVWHVLTLASHQADLPPALVAAFERLDLQSASEPARLAVANTARHVAVDRLYLAVALVLLLRVAFDVLRTSRHVRGAQEVSRSRLGGHRASSGLSVRRSDRPGSPFTWGLFRPVIVVPSDWDDWSRGKKQAVISHECAHIRRRDLLTALVSLLACCLLWMNPLVWLAHRRLRREAERACDDCVVGRGVNAHRYAAYLVEIARSANPGPAPAMATGSTLSRRVQALLDPTTRRFDMPRRYTLATVATAIVVMSGAAVLAVSATEEIDASAAGRLETCGQHLPPDSQFVMELSANWNTKAGAKPGNDFRLSFTFGDRNRPDLVGYVPDELLDFAQCLSQALTQQALEVPARDDRAS